jgi:hypothetical protein
VGLEVLGQVDDALGENGDLDLGGSGIFATAGMFLNDFLLTFGCHRHRQFLSN